MAEKSCCVELFNFDRVLWDKRSRRRICQVSFKQWTLAWCGQQSLILVNTKDVEASAHVSLEPIRGEIRAVSCQSSTEAMFLAVLTEKSALFSVTVRCDVTGKPDVQSVVQLDSHMQQEGDLIDVAYHSEKQLILAWSKRTLHIWSETTDAHWDRGDLDIHLRTGDCVRVCCWMPLGGGGISLLLAAGEMIQHAKLDPDALKMSIISSMQLPGPVRRLVTDGSESWIVAGCEAPLLKSLTLHPKSEFLIAEAAAPSQMPHSANPANVITSTDNVSSVSACVVVMATDKWGSPRILTTVPVPDMVTPDLVAVTLSSHIIVSSLMSAGVSIFSGGESAKLLTRVNLEVCGIGRLLEIFPDSLSKDTLTCHAVVKHGNSGVSVDNTSPAFLSLRSKQLCTVKLVQIDFSFVQSKNERDRGTNRKVKEETSDVRSGVVIGVEKGEEAELLLNCGRAEKLALGVSELKLPGLVLPPPAARSTWNPVPALLGSASTGLVSSGGPREEAGHVDLSSLCEDSSRGALDLTELMSSRERKREGVEGERGWVEEAMKPPGTAVGNEWRMHRKEKTVASARWHGDSSEATEVAAARSSQYPSVEDAEVLDVSLCEPAPSPQQIVTLSFLLYRGTLHLPTVKKAFGLLPDALLVTQLGGKDVILVQDGKGFLPMSFSKGQVLQISTLVTQRHV